MISPVCYVITSRWNETALLTALAASRSPLSPPWRSPPPLVPPCPPLPIHPGVKENLASATKKLDRALGKLALLTRSGKDGQERG